MTTASEHGFHTTPSTARELPAAGGHLLAGAADTGGELSVIDSTVPPRDSVPLHRHRAMDESFVVLDGSFTVTCGDDEFELSTGGFAFLPRGIGHRYVAGPDGGRLLIIATPGGLEQFFDDWESGTSLDDAARTHGVEFLG